MLQQKDKKEDKREKKSDKEYEKPSITKYSKLKRASTASTSS